MNSPHRSLATSGRQSLHALHHQLLRRAVTQFFPDATLSVGRVPLKAAGSERAWGIHFNCGGSSCLCSRARPFSRGERRLIEMFASVISRRLFEALRPSGDDADDPLIGGLPEDRFVVEYLLSGAGQTVVAPLINAIDVLRLIGSMSYENRRVTAGVLVTSGSPAQNPDEVVPFSPRRAVPFDRRLAAIKSLPRWCEGLRAVGLVDSRGFLSGVSDVRVEAAGASALCLPHAERYEPFARATLDGRRIGLALTPNGEIKVFANGVQTFAFVDGQWRLTDLADKYDAIRHRLGDQRLAWRLLTLALNLAENRQGALLVVVPPIGEAELVSAADRLIGDESHPHARSSSKQDLHYLLAGTNVLNLSTAIVESVARIDGALVMRLTGELIAVGAILQGSGVVSGVEGARTTAALQASRRGTVLKVSEDGVVSLFQDGAAVWHL